jgi:hypothetical protein
VLSLFEKEDWCLRSSVDLTDQKTLPVSLPFLCVGTSSIERGKQQNTSSSKTKENFAMQNLQTTN